MTLPYCGWADEFFWLRSLNKDWWEREDWILERVDAVTVKERRAARGINPRVTLEDGEMGNGWRWRERKEGGEEAYVKERERESGERVRERSLILRCVSENWIKQRKGWLRLLWVQRVWRGSVWKRAKTFSLLQVLIYIL